MDHRKDTQKVQSRVFKNDAISLDRMQILHFSGSQIDHFSIKTACFIVFAGHAKSSFSLPFQQPILVKNRDPENRIKINKNG